MTDDIKVNVIGYEIDKTEQEAYLQRGREKFGSMLNGMDIMVGNGYVVLGYHIRSHPFEKIPRIRKEDQ